MIPFRGVAAVAWVFAAAACLPGGGAPMSGSGSGPPPAAQTATILVPGPATPEEHSQAEAFLGQAKRALERGDDAAARAAAERVVESYPSTRASGEAAWVLAHALWRMGQGVAAEAAASRYAASLPYDDVRRTEVLLFQAERLREAGEPLAALRRLLELPSELPDTLRTHALAQVRDHASTLPREALATALAATPLGQPLAAPVMLAYAMAQILAGNEAQAGRYADAILALVPDGEEADGARALLERRAEVQSAETLLIGVLLPLGGGGASLQAFARGVEEGARAALTAEGLEGSLGSLMVQDDRGTQQGATEGFLVLEDAGVLGVVGPLGGSLGSAVAARGGAVPLISPDAGTVTGARSVYSLSTPDPEGPRTLARYAADQGILQVVILHSTEARSSAEAAIFAEAFESLGGSVLRTVPYGVTSAAALRAPLDIIRNLRPQAIVVPAPEGDIAALAPQLSAAGLDALRIRILGTEAWASPHVLAQVPARHTNGVVASTVAAGVESPGRLRFEQAFEALFQRSPPGDGSAALGYDAASLLLLAVRAGARTPADVARALEQVRAFPGATGVLSVEEGRIVRVHHLVCIQEQRPVPCSANGR